MRHHRPTRTPRYIWQLSDWPHLVFDAAALAAPLAQVHRAQDMLAGRMAALGLPQRDQATLQVLTQEVITTSAIEGERLDLDAVRSSVARKLGLDIGEKQEVGAPSDRYVDGVVDVVLDATRNFDQPLNPERLFGWHAALFPTGYSGRTRITVAAWRTDASGPMQVVSGQNTDDMGREKVHFEAPPAAALPAQTQAFFDWFEAAPAGDAKHAHECAANAGVEPRAGRHGRQADQRQVGGDGQMLCGYGAAGYQWAASNLKCNTYQN